MCCIGGMWRHLVSCFLYKQKFPKYIIINMYTYIKYTFRPVWYCYPQTQTDCTNVLLPSHVSQYNKLKLQARFKVAVCVVRKIWFRNACEEPQVITQDRSAIHCAKFVSEHDIKGKGKTWRVAPHILNVHRTSRCVIESLLSRLYSPYGLHSFRKTQRLAD